MKSLTAWLRRHTAAAAFVLGLALLTGVFWLSFHGATRLVVEADWRQHTFQVIAAARGLLNLMTDAENGERGYLLTGDERFLSRYELARIHGPRRILKLQALTADNPVQQQQVALVGPAAAAVFDNLARGVAWRRAHAAGEVTVASQVESRRAMDGLRRRLAGMEAEELHRLAMRDEEMMGTAGRTDLSLLAGLLASIVLQLGAFLALRRENRQRLLAETATANLNTRLAAANCELEAFCYSVSHDLRAPLRAVDGFSQALLEDAADRLLPAERALLARVRAAAQRMAALIDDLLRLSRISRTAIVPRRVDLSALARAAAAELRQADPARRVDVDIADGVHGVGDERLLRLVFDNLFANAWKFTRHRESAHIAFGVEPGDEQEVYFVRDDGAGFDMAHAKHLFGAFQRLHAEREFEGTGIGLATVARVIHLHGGRVWAEAAVNAGATLYFSLPPLQPAQPAAAPAAREAAA